VVGLVGAVVFGLILDQKHCYREALRIGYGTAFLTVWALFVALDRRSRVVIYVCFALLGFFMIPMMPATMESAAECTFPISEDDSVGLLMTSGNLVGVILTVALDGIISNTSADLSGTKYVFGAQNMFIAAFSLTAFVSIWFFNGEYRRLARDNQHK
jgi:FLVCR family MFS transporter 7